MSQSHTLLQKKDGVAALLTVVIIGGATLIMAFTASLLGLGELEMGYDAGQGGETFSVAEGCMEEGFERLRRDAAYSGGSLSLGDGSCTIGVVSASANRIITVTSTIGNYHKVIQMDVDIAPSTEITVNSWIEL